ncbi:MAG: MucBP domain-containing protein, partial [Vagococcus sp.]
MADNTWKQFDISWKPIIENGVLKADLTYSVGSLTQTYRVEDVVKMFNGTKTYFGFTSSTGSNKIFQGVSINSLPQKGFVYTYYKDIDTLDEIVPEIEFSGPIGTKWSSEKKDFSEMNYEFVKIEGNSDVVLTQDTQYITYWYKKLLPKVSLSKKVDKTTAKVG